MASTKRGLDGSARDYYLTTDPCSAFIGVVSKESFIVMARLISA